MDLLVAEFWGLFAVTLILQIVAISARRLFVSLFFSFLYSVVISLILIAMGHLWLAMANLWLSSGLTYFALIKTSLLIGTHKTFKGRRRMTLSFILYSIIVLGFSAITAFLMPQFQTPIRVPDSSLQHGIRSIIAVEQGFVTLTLALMALSALISVFLLVRRDDVMER